MILLKKLYPYAIVLGIIGYILLMYFNFNSLVTEITTEQGITMYQFNWHQYLLNWEKSLQQKPPPLDTIIPKKTFRNVGGSDWYNDLFNNLLVLFNYLYMPLNIVLYVINWFAYIARFAFIALGWPMTQTNGVYDSVLIGIMSELTQINIPYIE